MCLAIPMKIKKIVDSDSAIVESEGTEASANISLIEEPEVNDYVLVHAGFAIERIDTEEAEKTIELLKSIADLDNEIY